MADIPDLLQTQLGKETTWGTGVTPTVKLMGIKDFKLSPVNEAIVHEAQMGSLAPSPDANLTKIAGKASGNGDVVYEDIAYWLDSLFSEDTPSGADPYTYEHAAPLTAVTTPRKMTVVHGQGSDVYGLEGGLVNQLVISGKTGEALQFSVDMIGENVLTDALAALADRAVNMVMADHVALYIDAWGGTIGTTAISTAFFAFTLTINANRDTYPGFGQLKPKGYRDAKYTGTLQMSLEFDATTKAYLDAIIGGSAVFQKQVRIKASNGASLDLQLDFAGSSLTSPEPFTDENGVVSLDINLDGTYNSALGNWFEAQTINGVATLP